MTTVPVHRNSPPLRVLLGQFGRKLGKAVVIDAALCTVVAGVYVWRHRDEFL